MEFSHPLTKPFGLFLIVLVMCMIAAQLMPQLDIIAAWQEPENKITVAIFQFISDSISFISFGIPVIITLVGEFKKESNKKQNRLSLLYVVLSIAIGGLISYLMKKTFSEPRPYEVDPRIIQLSVGGGYSLPSGHTTEAFASATALVFLFPRWLVALPVFMWASLVALSRIYLGVHYPFDIFVGMFIGMSVAFLWYRFVFWKPLNHFATS
ncbi:MAG TPA: phosphatase PAP2 family protein [Cyclobacteriaceae bacterium]|jgi:undecaprenyl-diphosphatase|nr:phosphatase PAP2 family protein [Cyclobacteriaceae bacterium]